MSSCVCWFGAYCYTLLQLSLFLVHMLKDLSRCYTKTCLRTETDYSPELFKKTLVEKHYVLDAKPSSLSFTFVHHL